MKIEWKTIENSDYETLDKWLSVEDKINLCMQTKSWKETATDIGDCLKYMDNAEFKNLIGCVNGKPVVAVMFGIEQIKVLNLYNIVVNPNFRNYGIAKNVIQQLIKNDSSLKLSKPYKKVVASCLLENKKVQKLFENMEFKNLGFDGEYIVFDKNIEKTDEKSL